MSVFPVYSPLSPLLPSVGNDGTGGGTGTGSAQDSPAAVYSASGRLASQPATYGPPGAFPSLFGFSGQVSSNPLAGAGEQFLGRLGVTDVQTSTSSALVSLLAQSSTLFQQKPATRQSSSADDGRTKTADVSKSFDSFKARTAIDAYARLQPDSQRSSDQRRNWGAG